MEIRDRIQLLIAKERLTPSQFADSIDVQRSSISHILNGRNKPSLDYLQKILTQYPDYDANWLVLGIGEPKRSNIKHEQITPKGNIQLPLFNNEPDIKTEVTDVNKSIISPIPANSKVINEEAYNDNKEAEPKKPADSIKDESTINMIKPELGKEIEQIVVFYTDGTFKAYNKG